MIGSVEVTGTAGTADVPAGDVAVTAKDFGFALPTTPLIAGKHTFTFTNEGPSPHEASLVKLSEGITVGKVVEMLQASTPPSGPPPWTSAGGIAGVQPGTVSSFDVDVPAGSYALVCFIPDPATGKNHLELGMIAGVTVQ